MVLGESLSEGLEEPELPLEVPEASVEPELLDELPEEPLLSEPEE